MQIGIVSPDDQQFAQVLDRRAFELAADSRQQRIALAAHVAEHADLDQLMRFERTIDLVQHGGRQSVHTDRDNGTQVVRLGAQRATLLGGHIIHPRSLSRAPQARTAYGKAIYILQRHEQPCRLNLAKFKRIDK